MEAFIAARNLFFFVPAFHGVDMKDVCFQLDDAICHTSHVTIDLLRQKFDGRLISRNDVVNYPPKVRFDIVGLFPVGRR